MPSMLNGKHKIPDESLQNIQAVIYNLSIISEGG